MLADFPHWYASLGLGDDQAHRQLRWNAVGAIAAEASAATIEALLRLAFNTKQRPHEEAVTAFRHAIRQADPTAPPTGNDRELEILAASALAAIMSAGGLSGARAAMGITTTAGNGRREPSLPMDLPTLANAQLTIIARGIRQRTPIVISAASEVTFSLDDAAAKAKEGNFEAASQAFTIAATEIQKSLQTLANRQVKLVHTLNQTLRLQDEELNMLWWLTGGFSFDLHKPFHDVAALSRPLVFAKELADLTAFAPGPATATALFSRAGLTDATCSIASAVNTTPTPLLQQLVHMQQPSPVSTPIHYAILRQVETGPGDAWLAGWSAATELDPQTKTSSLTMGTLFYHERLLLRPDE